MEFIIRHHNHCNWNKDIISWAGAHILEIKAGFCVCLILRACPKIAKQNKNVIFILIAVNVLRLLNAVDPNEGGVHIKHYLCRIDISQKKAVLKIAFNRDHSNLNTVHWINMNHLPIWANFASLVLGQSFDGPSANDETRIYEYLQVSTIRRT